jgi:hypothetical protein
MLVPIVGSKIAVVKIGMLAREIMCASLDCRCDRGIFVNKLNVYNVVVHVPILVAKIP